jgi:hypothetical protein
MTTVTFCFRMSVAPQRQTPKKLLKEAKEEQNQRPYNLLDYDRVIDTLFQKEFAARSTTFIAPCSRDDRLRRPERSWMSFTRQPRRRATISTGPKFQILEPRNSSKKAKRGNSMPRRIKWTHYGNGNSENRNEWRPQLRVGAIANL